MVEGGVFLLTFHFQVVIVYFRAHTVIIIFPTQMAKKWGGQKKNTHTYIIILYYIILYYIYIILYYIIYYILYYIILYIYYYIIYRWKRYGYYKWLGTIFRNSW